MDKKDIVYHGSKKNGLTRLEPFLCKHDKPYVYATKDYWVALFFASKGKGMFDGWLSEDENGTPIFYEARPNSFQERYEGESSYCYHLPAETFISATDDSKEVVSEVAVDILKCEEIKDIGAEFKSLIEKGDFKVIAYNTSKENNEENCEKYILKILNKRGYFEGKDFRQREWASQYYKDLIDEYQNQLDL